jgi:VWFA-related protein
VLLLAVFFIALGALAQEPDVVFRTGVSLVRVDAQVMQGNRVVPDLTKDDFVVYDQGVRVPINYLAADQEPLDLLILLDVSDSMRDAIQAVNRVTGKALGQLRTGDRVALARFTSTWNLVVPFTEELSKIKTASEVIAAQDFSGGTDIIRALDESAELFSTGKRTARRRAVLMISDGKAPHYFRDEQTLQRLWAADVVVHALLVKSKSKESSLPIDMPKLTEATGGESIRADEPGAAFEELMERVRRRYSILYPLPAGAPQQQRSLRVELSDTARKRYPTAKVRARRGYVWSPDAGAESAGGGGGELRQ